MRRRNPVEVMHDLVHGYARMARRSRIRELDVDTQSLIFAAFVAGASSFIKPRSASTDAVCDELVRVIDEVVRARTPQSPPH